MAEISVILSAAFREAYLELVPRFEQGGHAVETRWAPSVEIMQRLKGGEMVDVVIASARAIDELIALGIAARPRYDLATCGVGVAVRAGAPRPDLSSADALKRAVLAAKSIVYSHGPSGVYLAGLFERMGIAREIESRVQRVQGEPAGAVVARGDAEIGFQQICELLPVPGIDLVGPLPAEVQEITTFSAGLHARSPAREVARRLVEFLSGAQAAPIIRAKGMDPLGAQPR